MRVCQKACQRVFSFSRYIGVDFTSPPFNKVTELFGAQDFRAKKIAEVGEEVQVELHNTWAAVIEGAIDSKT